MQKEPQSIDYMRNNYVIVPLWCLLKCKNVPKLNGIKNGPNRIPHVVKLWAQFMPL